MSATELNWSKSSYSSAQGDSCIEIAATEQDVHVRDSKDVTRPSFGVRHVEWGQFVRHVARRP
ncbi:MULTISPECIES: DUF397 domain-containing protein [unclassified Embleya]|uniref:DUF397 domain-containing protein n=1 Tax=unclassified Embleya TaxID=2699296 RepID=UPI0036B5C1A2